MNKKYTSVLALVFAGLFTLAACEKGSRYGVFITDEQGMTHVLVTNANGETIQDGKGNLVEVVTDSDKKKPIINPAQTVTVTDESGVASEYNLPEEYQTQSITFPVFIEDEDSVEVAEYVMPKPEGWEMTGSQSIILKHTETETIIDTYEGGYASIEEALETIEEQRQNLTKEIPYSYEDVEICGTTGVKCHYDLGDMQRYLYFVLENGIVYRFGVTIKNQYEDKVDYEAILNGIKFR